MTRKEAIEILSDIGDINRCCAEDAEALDMAIKALEQQPKVGKWIKTSLSQVSGGDFNRGFKCSCCGYVTVVDDFNYCPNCGARMAESEK